MTIHREPPPVIEGKKWTAVIVYGALSSFIRAKEEQGITDLWLWRDEHNLLCAAWQIEAPRRHSEPVGQ